jgi:UDP:flavonoid glycosyltransferase YjiC (YdhE family)
MARPIGVIMPSATNGMKMMVSFWDGGRCHFTRAMTLAEEAQKRGLEVGVITSEKYAQEVGSLAVANEVYVIPTRPPDTPPPPYEFPLYSHAFRHAQRLRGLRFDNIDWLHEVTAKEIEAIRDFKADVIVNDYRDTIRTSAQVNGVPVVGVTHTTGNVDGLPFVWWTTPPNNVTLPDCRNSFNHVRADYGLDPIIDEREMFSGDINLIPSSPSLESLVNNSGNSHYVGVLSGWKPNDSFHPIDPSLVSKKLFSYVGEPTRPQYGYEDMLTQVISEEPDMGFYIVGSPNRYSSKSIDARRRDGTVVVAEFLPGSLAINDSSVVLSHGGNGTTMLSLAMGKPIVCIGPYQSDCMSTFKGIEEQGAGVMLNHSTGPFERRPAPDLGEGVEIFGYWKTKLSAIMIHDAIRKVLDDERFFLNAQRLGRELIELGGAERALDLIQEVA